MTSANPAPGQAAAPAAVWNGQHLFDAISTAATWLDANQDRVNALNVFPVPDGDTGTNMALTMSAALAEARGPLRRSESKCDGCCRQTGPTVP